MISFKPLKRCLPVVLLVLSGQLSAAELIGPAAEGPIENVGIQQRKKAVRSLPPPPAKGKNTKNKTVKAAPATGHAKKSTKPNAAIKRRPAIGASHALSSRQMSIARDVQTGSFSCAFGITVKLAPDSRMKGRFVLGSGNKRYTLYPAPTTNGAVRLEDNSAGIVWLQLPSKSMLVSQKEGRRIADECINYAGTQEKKMTPSAGSKPASSGKTNKASKSPKSTSKSSNKPKS
ncbi:MAG: hypothetical protein RLZZ495_586 [Pseudomonadota bacterium]|jgi:hypothetical protein